MYDYSSVGGYCHNRLSMIVANSSDNFQQKMNDLFHGFEFIYAYIDYLLVLPKGYWAGRVQKLELTLNKPKGKELQYNI